MEWIQPLRVASAMTKSGRTRFAFSALRWKLPKSWPTMGSSQTRCRLGSPIMLLSHVLPLRPEPKIQTMFSGLTPVAGAPSNPLRSQAARRGISLYLPASQRRPLRSTSGRPSVALLSLTPNATLPAVVLLVAEPDQEFPGFLFVDLLVALVEQVFPVARNALTIEGSGILLAPLATPGELLEGRLVNAVLHQSLLCIDPEEAQQPFDFLVGVLQQVFVAHLRIAVPEQGGSVLDGLAHPEGPVLGGFPQRLLGEHPLASLREFLGPPAVGLASCQLFGREPVRTAPLGAVALLVYEGDRLVPAVSDYVDHPGLRIDLVDLLDELRAQQRRLVSHEPLTAPGEPLVEEVVRRQAQQGLQVLVRVAVSAPHRALDPQPQVFGAQQRVVERAGRLPGHHPRYVLYLSPVLSAEEEALALAED